MDENIKEAEHHFIQGLSRIAAFWGFPKAMGSVYGVVYLAQDPITLDDLTLKTGVSKGAVSTNIRHLERLGMVHKQMKMGDRKDYYTAETDFWKIIQGVLKEREKPEFDIAVKTVGESVEMLKAVEKESGQTDTTQFYIERLEIMEKLFQRIDKLVAALLVLKKPGKMNLIKMIGKLF